MALDKNSYCPGGTGKKIKHCACQEITGELEKIVTAIQGEQRIAALDRINRTLATKANRPCLLALKIMVLMDMKDMQSLEDTVTTFVKVAPDNVMAHTFAAILESRKHQLREAVDELQAALGLLQDILPSELLGALEEVGDQLARSGAYLAARAHMTVRATLDPDNEECARPLLMLLNAKRVPSALKLNLEFMPSPSGATWKARFDSAMQDLMHQGWKKGLEKFEKLNQDFPGQPAVLYNIALARSCLAAPKASEAWQAYARCPGTEFQKAVEAEALGQLLTWEASQSTVPLVRWSVEVEDANALNEKLLSSKLCQPLKGDLSSMRTADSPPPKSAFVLLDRPLPEKDVAVTVDNVPRALANLALYGRETDRAARIELAIPKTAAMQQARAILQEVAGTLLTAAESEEVLDSIPRLQLVLNPACVFTAEPTLLERQHVHDAILQRAVSEEWPDIPLEFLDDKTPRQVKDDPAYRVPLAGALLALEQLAESHPWPIDVNSLREQLGVPLPAPIDPRTVDVSDLSPMEFTRVPTDLLTDEQLLQLYERAVICAVRPAVVRTAEEVLRRPDVSARVDLAHLHEVVADMTMDSDQAVRSLQESQRATVAAKRSPAMLLIKELSMRMLRGESAEASRVLQVIQTRHMQEPGVAETLYSLLVQLGIIGPDGQPARSVQAPQTEEPAPPASAGLWTPDAPAATAAEKKPSQLWVPD